MSASFDASEIGQTEQRPLAGITLKILSTIVFVIMAAMVKQLSGDVPTGEIVFARNFAGMVPVLVWMMWQRRLLSSIRTTRPFGHFFRSFIGVTAMTLNFAALAYIPLPDATAISYAAPLMTVVLAVFVLGEVVGIYRWSAVGVGFFGVLIILYPHLGTTDMHGDTAFGALLAFIGTIFMALAAIIVRKLILTERSATIVLWFSGSSSVMALMTLPIGWAWPSWAWVMPDPQQWVLLVATGLVGGWGRFSSPRAIATPTPRRSRPSTTRR
ncbi:DMT family transporter [Breoghania sp. L-A4]|uniref:DMT family transporter n=1 Tax=Breoghania sp. L-A4 TaxID=2304600 RepID=UPI001968300B|nr:DMT family transporter [Breoghania sp. L-A4]